MWNFWSWKTFSEQLKMYETNENQVYVISNVPYSRCDYFFSSEEDLINVFSVLDEYCQETNYHVKEYAQNLKKYKDIYIIIDEAHRYFDSRSSLLKWNNLEKMNNVLTQCRKRNIRIVAITQRLTMIDIRFRRLSDYVEEYRRGEFFGVYWVRHFVYENRGDLADIETDNVVKVTADGESKTLKEDCLIYKEFFSPLTFGLQLWSVFNKAYRKIAKEYYNTYYICALHDENVKEFNLQVLQDGLLKSEYRNVKEYTNKMTLFNKAWAWLVNFHNKIWTKIENVFNTDHQGLNLQDREQNFQDLHQDNKIILDLFKEKMKENV